MSEKPWWDESVLRQLLLTAPQAHVMQGVEYLCYVPIRKSFPGMYVATRADCCRTYVICPVTDTAAEVIPTDGVIARSVWYVTPQQLLARLQACSSPNTRDAVAQMFTGGIAVPYKFGEELAELLEDSTRSPEIAALASDIRNYARGDFTHGSPRLQQACANALNLLLA